MQENINWHRLDNADQVAAAACQHIINTATQAIAERGSFKLMLAGGNTPEKVYRLLGQTVADWEKWVIYYGDERCIPADHAERNSTIAQQAFLDHVAIPTEHIFTIAAELGGEKAAELYRPIVASGQPFDLVLLGLGEDGHTASLFPNQQHNADELVHAVYDSPKPPSDRVSVSAKVLSNTHELIFLVTGTNKQDIVQQWRAGASLPATTIVPKNAIDIYIDNAAFPA